jgi:hypothetical protein
MNDPALTSLPGDPSRPRLRPWSLRLETWLVLAALLLVCQLFPSIFWGALYLVDVRNWSWAAWVGVEASVVLILLALWRWQNSDP